MSEVESVAWEMWLAAWFRSDWHVLGKEFGEEGKGGDSYAARDECSTEEKGKRRSE